MSKSANISVIERGSSPYHTIMLLAWPIILEQIMMTMVQYVDTAMVGSLGAAATAAVAINQSPVNLINGIMMSCGVAFTALVARSIGANDTERAKRVVAQSVLVAIGLGIFSTILMGGFSSQIPAFMGADIEIQPDANRYLLFISASMLFKSMTIIFSGICRGSGNTKTPMKVNFFVNIINVVGNYLLIFPTRTITLGGSSFTVWGAGMGVAGAALATTLSIIFGGIVMTYFVMLHSPAIAPDKETSFKPDKEILSVAFRIGLPAAGERLAMSTAQIMVTMIIAGLGTVSLAAHHLAITAESVCFMPGFGFASAATTLTGQALGAERDDLTNSLTKSCIKMALCFMTCMGIILFFLAPYLIGIFSPDQEVIDLGAACLRIIAFSQPFFAVSMTITGILRGAGDTKVPFYVILVSMWGVRVGLAYVLVLMMGMGLQALWLCMCFDFVLRSVLFTYRYKSGRWKHALKHS